MSELYALRKPPLTEPGSRPCALLVISSSGRTIKDQEAWRFLRECAGPASRVKHRVGKSNRSRSKRSKVKSYWPLACPLMARNRNFDRTDECPLSGAKRTSWLRNRAPREVMTKYVAAASVLLLAIAGVNFGTDQIRHPKGTHRGDVKKNQHSHPPVFDYRKGTSNWPYGPRYNFPYPDRPYGDPGHGGE